MDSLYWTDCWYDHERNTLPADLINTSEPNLVVQIASLSNRYYPGDFFDKTLGYIPWTMDLITSTRPFVVLTASCGGADYARTEHPVYQISVPHEFLAEPDKGAVAWIGPTAGSWQNGNEVIARAIIGELFENPQRPMGESYTNAIRSVLLQYVDVPDIVQTARSFQFLGDPMLPFMFVVTSAETKKDHRQPSALCLYHCRPNPFNPSTMILFDLPAQVFVTLKVYSVNGRLIKTLAAQEFPAGHHSVRCDGRNFDGKEVASGVYYCRLQTSIGTETKKMTLLK